MEEKETGIITQIKNNNNNEKAPHHVAKKKRGALHLVRVALFMLRRRSAGKSNSAHVDVASKGLWKKLVAAMRPLHLQDQKSQPSSIESAPTTPAVELSLQRAFSSSSSSSGSDDDISVYASAQNLQELDRREGCGEIQDDVGDEMIDARAEKFIAHFYEQMRLQRLDSIKRYNEMIQMESR